MAAQVEIQFCPPIFFLQLPVNRTITAARGWGMFKRVIYFFIKGTHRLCRAKLGDKKTPVNISLFFI